MTADTSPVLDRQTVQNVATDSTPIDTQVLFSRCMGNVSFALTLLNELEANGKQQVEAIVRHIANNEPHAASEAAHSLKGAAAILGAERLREKAAEIEAATRDSDTSFSLGMVHDLRSEMDRCLAYIPTLQAETQRR